MLFSSVSASNRLFYGLTVYIWGELLVKVLYVYDYGNVTMFI